MPTRVQLPNGAVGEFPDGMSQQQIEAVLQKQFPAQKADAPKPSVWETMKSNFNAGTQHPAPPTSVLDMLSPKRAVENVGAGVGDFVRGIPSLLHKAQPRKLDEILKTGEEETNAFLDDPVGAYTSAAGQGAGMLLTGEALRGAAKGVGKILPKETIRKGVQSTVGAGAKPVAEEVSKAAEQSVKDRTAVAKSNREAQQAHAKGKEETAAANEETLRKQGKIEPTQQKLKGSSEELRARIETARQKALKVGNEKYNTVNGSLNPLSADMEKVHGAFYEAAESFGEAQAQPPLVKRLGDALHSGAELTYKDLQQLYSELGKELSKGTLPGPTFHAYDVLQEAIGDDMQRIANSHGEPIDTASVPRKMVDGKPTKEPAYTTAMGKQLFDARNYWRRMKQTFGKQYHPTDAATATAKSLNPDFASSEAQANQLRLLGSFDPEIPKAAQGVTNAQQGVDALGPKKPLRDILKPNPAPAETKPLPTTEVNTREIREKALDRWAKGESQFGRYQIARLASGGIGGIVGLALDHGVGAGIGGTVGATFGPAVLAKMVEMPAIREWLTRPPADELAALQKLPNADRITITDGLKQVVDTAQKQGKPIPVSAKVAVLLGLAPQKKRVAAALQP